MRLAARLIRAGSALAVLAALLVLSAGIAQASSHPTEAPDVEAAADEGVSGSSATISWDAVSATTRTGYDIQYREDGDTTWLDAPDAAADATSATLTGLDPSTAYEVQVRVAATGGDGPWSSTVSVTTGAIDAVSGLAATADTGVRGSSASLAWDADAATTRTGYDIQYREDGDTTWLDAPDAAADATSATLTGLDPSTTYEVQVRVTATGGDGPWSSTVSFTTSYAIDAPAAATGSGSVIPSSAEWVTGFGSFLCGAVATPACLGDSTTGYAITSGSLARTLRLAFGDPPEGAVLTSAQLRVTASCNRTDATSSGSVTPTVNGQTLDPRTFINRATRTLVYTFTDPPYAAHDVDLTVSPCGNRDARIHAVVWVLEYDLPGAPVLAPTVHTNGVGADFTWEAVTVTGGNGYELRYRPTGAEAWTTETLHPDDTALAITGLDLSTAYEAEARVTTSTYGPGPWSTAVTFTTPSLPAALSAAPVANAEGPSTVNLSWFAVSNTTGYTVRYCPAPYADCPAGADGTGWLTGNVDFTGASAAVSKLAWGQTYRFEAAGVNDAGRGPWSGQATEATSVPPAPAIRGLNAFTDGTGMTLNWVLLSTTGFLPSAPNLDGYQVEWRETSAAQWTTAPTTTSGAAFVTIRDLSPGGVYHARVRGKYSPPAGQPDAFGEWSGAGGGGNAVTLPDFPDTPANLVRDSVTATSVTVSWDAVAGAASYEVEHRQQGQTTAYSDTGVSIDREARTARITGLQVSVAFEVRIRARSAVGPSEWSPPLAVSTAGLPPAPTGLAVSARSEASLTVRWTAVTTTPPVTGYDVQLRRSGAAWPSSGTSVTTREHVFTNLGPGTSYDIRVAAVNSDGTGAYADPIGPHFTLQPPPAVFKVDGAMLFRDAADEGDLLVLGTYEIAAVPGRTVDDLFTVALAHDGHAFAANTLFPFYHDAEPDPDNPNRCRGFAAAAGGASRTPCPNPNGFGAGLFTLYLSAGEAVSNGLPAAGAPEQLTVSILGNPSVFTSAARSDPMTVAYKEDASDFADSLTTALQDLGSTWGVALTDGDQATALGSAYLQGVLPNVRQFDVALLAAYRVGLVLEPDRSRGQLADTAALTPTGAFEQPVAEVAVLTGLGEGAVKGLLSFAFVLVFIAIAAKGNGAAGARTATGLSIAVILPVAIMTSFIPAAAGALTMALLGGVAVLAKIRSTIPA